MVQSDILAQMILAISRLVNRKFLDPSTSNEYADEPHSGTPSDFEESGAFSNKLFEQNANL